MGAEFRACKSVALIVSAAGDEDGAIGQQRRRVVASRSEEIPI